MAKISLTKNLKKYIYPLTTTCIILIFVGILVVLAAFISQLIDFALVSEQESKNKELELQIGATENAKIQYQIKNDVPLSEILQSSTTETTTTPITKDNQSEKKELLSISILNSTGISGKAGKLAQLITDSGFKVSYTGNAKKREPVTIVQIKETSKKIFPESFKEVLKIVGSQYSTIESVLDANSEYDVVITIGAN
ncbi:MAG: LytR C-terminal domain-containing protein [Candidatus Paceibacterota bacterium]|jgi:hypothetical protein